MNTPTAEQLANASKWAAYFAKYGDYVAAELIRLAWSTENDGKTLKGTDMNTPTAEQLANASKWAAYFEKYGDYVAAELIRLAWSIENDG